MERLSSNPSTNIDPACGMKVEPGKTRLVSVYHGNSKWFCAEGCRETFETNPQKYLDAKIKKQKGIWGRYLDRLNRATKSKLLKCH
jgi:YHS domain-containing protein